ncbi:reactive intermediate/imine deaminase [Lacticaseibacillus chiayiensis]|uniref:Reactive intermediate/imine deaminase n=1 Tax=Lacticaseibacillus chiayiensis TaxID=2100821 RepID=A0A4Q1U6C5_9LACO|nr:RidA family protein [Lacticaseibacillus chiayiensis]QVI34829.1 RidA family protein [Lacticaseibacillus chiayiensis]RXT27186.1 reactive intermediate/imine deaminase [Lacticaseibacillus chiayiensis]RXT58259.1 reactive intermediate/imine deaminase [Lacticaseibacillus chiayiensis]UYN56582.1 RidA family protein [Lacticaseibacillus chiayiensis]
MIKRLTSTNAPAPIGSYSAATQIGSVLFTSGQLPFIPESKDIPDGIIAQTKQVMANLNHILVDNGTSFDHVAKTTVYINDLKLLPTFDQVYRSYFHDGFPARTAVLVSELPAQTLLEVDMVAEVPED